MFIRFALIAVLLSLPTVAFAGDATNSTEMSDKEYKEFLAKSPLNEMYPKQVGPAAAQYFGEWSKLFEDGPIASKEARLVAVSASAAIRCEYCITAQVHLAKKAGATDDEIKTAIQIAAEVSRFSVLLYGNEFGQEKLKKVLKITPEKESK
jgi:AhpD family alkylhydroperoxidase